MPIPWRLSPNFGTQVASVTSLSCSIHDLKEKTWHYLLARWAPADSISQRLDLAPGRSEAEGGPLDGGRRTIPNPCIWDSKNPMKEPCRVLKPDSIRRECEASLRRLGIERIDLYQFHWPDDTGTPIEDSWSEMLKLVKEGKIRAGGHVRA